ncbi:sigma-54-dependent transcriptional regulator [Candidatus Hepatobacter penaei]|uniref:sigma-54-dependent transcriptional regulator n=1 Tax=Candidatus Hepatobacter penaei TaxID=1274402 RepID=UPI0004F31600|nr:sigma-54 dependent transcriptional regulator [Candidatus Hepatobacter penaei]TGW14562.1 sigma-54-dependent Fis family transcriptional regulator [bacterium NHP-B]
MPRPPLLVVDDEPDICATIKDLLEDAGYQVCATHSAREALNALVHLPPLVVLLDVWLKASDGFSLLKRLTRSHPHTPVILMSGHGTLDIAAQAIQKGAYDFIEKPFHTDRLLLAIQRALREKKLQHDRQRLTTYTHDTPLFDHTKGLRAVHHHCTALTRHIHAMLIEGEAGTEKSRLAHWIHTHSPETVHGHYVEVHAHTLDPHTFDDTFLGREEPHFGLEQCGLVDHAFSGTLVIKHVHQLHPRIQKKLTHLIQTMTFTRSSGTSLPLQTRIIATTNTPLDREVTRTTFSQTLYDRLQMHHVRIPPLRMRKKDISALAHHHLHTLCTRYGQKPRSLMPETVTALESYAWPGNTRELKNHLERCLLLTDPDNEAPLVCPSPAPTSHPQAASFLHDYLRMPLKQARAHFEKKYLMAQIERFDGNIQKTSQFVDMERSALHRKIRMLRSTTTAQKTG